MLIKWTLDIYFGYTARCTRIVLEVRADRGHIHVTGRVDQGLEDEVAKLVKNVPGVTDVTTDVYSVTPDAFLGP